MWWDARMGQVPFERQRHPIGSGLRLLDQVRRAAPSSDGDALRSSAGCSERREYKLQATSCKLPRR